MSQEENIENPNYWYERLGTLTDNDIITLVNQPMTLI